jgi:hypothetical protein
MASDYLSMPQYQFQILVEFLTHSGTYLFFNLKFHLIFDPHLFILYNSIITNFHVIINH